MSDSWLLDAITSPRTNGNAEPREPGERIPLGRAAKDFIEHGAPLGDQRDAAVKAARNLWSDGYELDDATELIWQGLQASPWDPEKPDWTYEEAYAIAKSVFESDPPPLKPLEQGYPYIGSRNGHHADDGHDDGNGDAQHLESLPPFQRTDAGNAELFARLFGSGVRFDHRRRLWLIYDRHWWRRDDDGEVLRLAKEAARRRYLNAINIGNEHERTLEAKFAIGSENRAKIDALLALARAERPIADAGDGWDADPMLLGMDNGVLDLRAGELRDGRPEDKISRHAPVACDPDATAPLFEAWLAQMQPKSEIRTYLQRLCGMALTGDVSEQILPFMHGVHGREGKSTLALVMLGLLGPDYAGMAAPGLLLKKRGETHPTELADTHGKRLVISIEPDEGRAFAEALLKQLTGGDRMKARYMHADFFEFATTAKFWIIGNHKITVRGHDQAFWRRLKLVPFEVSIPEEDVDHHLVDRLLAERAGIFNWALQGCLDWQREGLAEPEIVRAAVAEYREEADELRPFFEECCVISPGARAGATALYKAYRTFTKELGNDKDALTQTRFGTRLSERFPKSRGVKGAVYEGIGLRGLAENDGL